MEVLQRAKIKRETKTAAHLMRIKGYDDTLECYILEDDSYANLYEIVCKDLFNISEEDMRYDQYTWAKFFKTHSDDIKIISMNYPTDTREQQAYVRHKILHTKNEIHKYFLKIKLKELMLIQEYRTNREYYLMIFSKNKEGLKENDYILKKSLGNNLLIRPLEKEKKQKIRFKMNNKATCIH